MNDLERKLAKIKLEAQDVTPYNTLMEVDPSLLLVLIEAFEKLKPLTNIANAYDCNDLDDEARKFWGKDGKEWEYENKRLPSEIELYSGRGGKQLLTLEDCMKARDVFEKLHTMAYLDCF